MHISMVSDTRSLAHHAQNIRVIYSYVYSHHPIRSQVCLALLNPLFLLQTSAFFTQLTCTSIFTCHSHAYSSVLLRRINE